MNLPLLGAIPTIYDIYSQEEEDAIIQKGFYIVNEHFTDGGIVYYFNYNNLKVADYTYAVKVLADNSTFFRIGNNEAWSPWREFAYDLPSFYKDYNSLADLKAALAAI